MQYYAGIDISLEQSSVCAVDAAKSSRKRRSLAILASWQRSSRGWVFRWRGSGSKRGPVALAVRGS